MTAVVASTPDAELDKPIAAGPRWAGPALAALLAATAVLYLWRLPINGYGNAFYAAAAQSGAQNWSAWFFGSLDPNDFVTVDKPPAALWVTGLSVRLFGMNPWSVLAPQALLGVAAVAVLYASVRRAVPDPRHGVGAGLLAGAVLALTPVAVLMFRYDNPDALMVLLTVLAAYCTTRAVSVASWRWLALAGAALGFAFLTKMLAGLMVLPALAFAYLMFAPTGWRKRLIHSAIAAATLVVSSAWWVVTVQLWPIDARPYISNSGDNSVLGLALGYNGVDRLMGSDEHGGHGIGVRRLFVAEMANEISWLLPAALVGLGFGLLLWRRGGLSRSEKSAVVIWGGWIMMCALIFSYMDGLGHPYYSVTMAPALSALVGLGGLWAWRQRLTRGGRMALAAMIGVSAAWSVHLLRATGFGPGWVRGLIGATATLAVLALIAGRGRGPISVATVAGALAGVSACASFAVATAMTPHTGAIPNAVHTATAWPTVGGRFAPVSEFQLGNLGTNSALAAELRQTHTMWAAATVGAPSASALEVTSGRPVMAIGGWSHDPIPTLDQFVAAVHAGRIAYYVDGGRGHGSSAFGAKIADWVKENYPSTIIGGARVYRLN